MLFTSIVSPVPSIPYPIIYSSAVNYLSNILQSYTKINFIFYLHYPDNVLYFICKNQKQKITKRITKMKFGLLDNDYVSTAQMLLLCVAAYISLL